MIRALVAALVALALAGAPAGAQDQATAPPPLVLDHEELVRRARTEVRGAEITYTASRVVLRGRVRFALRSWPVHVEASFVRVAGRVRLRVDELLVSGARLPSQKAAAEAKLRRLVDVESEAVRVVVRAGGATVFAQDVP